MEKKYRVIVISINGLGNKIHNCNDVIKESDLRPGAAERYVRTGHLELALHSPLKFTTNGKLVIGVVVPTIKSREFFLQRCKMMIGRQTMQPDFVEIVDQPGFDNKDTAWRYRVGFEKLFEQGCDVVLAMEDDDWYCETYIETMINKWVSDGHPEIFGINQTIYYHVVEKKYSIFKFAHASMMATLVTKNVLEYTWDYADVYLDLFLWKQMKGKVFIPEKPICLGIKHGLTEVAGGGHQENWVRYKENDDKLEYLRSVVGNDIGYYKLLGLKPNYQIKKTGSDKPYLTVITRRHGDKRPNALSKNLESIGKLKGEVEQIFVVDKKGLGVHMANTALQLVTDISGEWVVVLDDDDYFTKYDLVADLKKVDKDVGFVYIKMIIRWKGRTKGEVFPKATVWKKKPIFAGIGMTCFVVRKELYLKYSNKFGQVRGGDYSFIEALHNSGEKRIWKNKIYSETTAQNRGKAE